MSERGEDGQNPSESALLYEVAVELVFRERPESLQMHREAQHDNDTARIHLASYFSRIDSPIHNTQTVHIFELVCHGNTMVIGMRSFAEKGALYFALGDAVVIQTSASAGIKDAILLGIDEQELPSIRRALQDEHCVSASALDQSHRRYLHERGLLQGKMAEVLGGPLPKAKTPEENVVLAGLKRTAHWMREHFRKN